MLFPSLAPWSFLFGTLTILSSISYSSFSSYGHSFSALILEDYLEPIKEKVTGKRFTGREGTILSQISGKPF